MADSPDVLVVGEALVDIVERSGRRHEHVGGSPANVALGLGRLGISVELLTQVAADDHGRAVVDYLSESGVRVRSESIRAGETSTALARIAPDGHAEYEFALTWDAFAAPEQLASRVIHTGSVAAFLEPGAGSVRALLRASAASEVTFDPNIRAGLLPPREETVRLFEAVAQLCTVVKLSDEDAAWLYPDRAHDDVIDTILALGPRVAALTLGPDGACVATGEDRVRMPVTPVTVVDTIGAGDTFMASLIAAVLRRGSRSLDRAELRAIAANALRAAAVTVSRPGADLPWASELAPLDA